MIVGKLEDLNKYKGFSKNMDLAIDYFLNNDILNMSVGKYEIDQDNVFLVRDSYVARNLEDSFFETHVKYLDLQIVLKGKELFGYTDISNPHLVLTHEYSENIDMAKYSYDCKDAVYFTLEDGFAFVFPKDAHLPKRKINDEQVEKAIFKIKI